MKVLTLILAFTFLLMSATLGITGEDPDLVAYYPFEGNAEDASGNGNDGEIDGGSKWVKGKFGDAIHLDAAAFVLLQVSDSLHGDIFKADPFTISAWIQPNFEGTEWEHIWRSLPTASGHNTFFLNKTKDSSPGVDRSPVGQCYVRARVGLSKRISGCMLLS